MYEISGEAREMCTHDKFVNHLLLWLCDISMLFF